MIPAPGPLGCTAFPLGAEVLGDVKVALDKAEASEAVAHVNIDETDVPNLAVVGTDTEFVI